MHSPFRICPGCRSFFPFFFFMPICDFPAQLRIIACMSRGMAFHFNTDVLFPGGDPPRSPPPWYLCRISGAPFWPDTWPAPRPPWRGARRRVPGGARVVHPLPVHRRGPIIPNDRVMKVARFTGGRRCVMCELSPATSISGATASGNSPARQREAFSTGAKIVGESFHDPFYSPPSPRRIWLGFFFFFFVQTVMRSRQRSWFSLSPHYYKMFCLRDAGPENDITRTQGGKKKKKKGGGTNTQRTSSSSSSSSRRGRR